LERLARLARPERKGDLGKRRDHLLGDEPAEVAAVRRGRLVRRARPGHLGEVGAAGQFGRDLAGEVFRRDEDVAPLHLRRLLTDLGGQRRLDFFAGDRRHRHEAAEVVAVDAGLGEEGILEGRQARLRGRAGGGRVRGGDRVGWLRGRRREGARGFGNGAGVGANPGCPKALQGLRSGRRGRRRGPCRYQRRGRRGRLEWGIRGLELAEHPDLGLLRGDLPAEVTQPPEEKWSSTIRESVVWSTSVLPQTSGTSANDCWAS
jgi:hypothetical protein